MPVIEFQGKTTEEAIDNACNQLHIPSDELKFEIISTGSSGIFGLGGKKAAIRVTVEEKITAKAPEPEVRERPAPRPEYRERRDPRDSGERREQRENRAPRPYREAREPREHRDRRERGHYSRGDDRGERGYRPERQEKREPQPEYQPALLPKEMPLPPTMAGPEETVYQGPDDEGMIQAREVLSGILARMELEAEVTATRIEDRIILNVNGESSGLLIGKKGATLDAIQFLVNKIVNRTRTEKQRVVVDTEEYRQRRHQSLIELAQRMAAKAKRTRRPVTISSLSAHDRRVVHLALQNDTGLKTRSRGDGPLKSVVIIPGTGTGGSRKGGSRPRGPRGHETRAAVPPEEKMEAGPNEGYEPEPIANDFEEDDMD